MAGFLAGLGAALTEGSSLAARARAERRQQELDRQQREMDLARMALERRRADIAEAEFAAGQEDRARNYAKDLVQTIGPDGVADESAVKAIETGGYGSFLSPQENAVVQDPISLGNIELEGQQAPRRVLATTQQRLQLDAAKRQEALAAEDATRRSRAREAMSLPGFYAMPEQRRGMIWQDAGYDGDVPQSLDEWKDRERFQNEIATQRGIKVAQASATALNPQRTEWVLRNGVPTPINNTKDYQPGDVPYDAVAARQGNKGGTGGGVDFGQQRTRNIRQAIARLRGDTQDAQGNVIPGNRISRANTGFGSYLAYLPESEARGFASELEGLKANIIQKSLQEMRDASKTGGALGQVSDFENRLLALTMGPLDPAVHPEVFKQQLQNIEDTLVWWEQQKAAHPQDAAAIGAGDYNVPQPGQIGIGLDCSQRDPNTGKIVCR